MVRSHRQRCSGLGPGYSYFVARPNAGYKPINLETMAVSFSVCTTG